MYYLGTWILGLNHLRKDSIRRLSELPFLQATVLYWALAKETLSNRKSWDLE